MTDALAEARRALNLDTVCPVCRAGFSEPCRSASGRVRNRVHAGRRRPVTWLQPELFTVDEVT